MRLHGQRRSNLVTTIEQIEYLSNDKGITATARASASDAPLCFIQKNAHRVSVSSAKPTKMTRQIPKASSIGRLTARGDRCMTSSSWGSKETTSPSATDVTIFTQSI